MKHLLAGLLATTVLAVASTAQTLTPIYSFTTSQFDTNSPANPQCNLVQGPDGAFYGTTTQGGSGGKGTVFKVTTNGALTVLVNFAQTNGANPDNLILGSDGSFYGTTYLGGSGGYGTVFRVTTNGTLTTLVHSTPTNGTNPGRGLTLGADGDIYGMTAPDNGVDRGAVFRVTTNDTLTTLFTFGGTNGMSPVGLLQVGDGSFYGVTSAGGSGNYGTVFHLTTNGTLTTLVSFAKTNGANAGAALILAGDGNFYGMTQGGGKQDYGTVFKVTTNGTLTTLASFDLTNGAQPYAALTLGQDGTFYGTTAAGGSGGYGTVFRITTEGSLTTLVNFGLTNGGYPIGGLMLASDGNFYGTAQSGGSGDGGVIYRLELPPTITAQPPSVFLPGGSNFLFTVTATSSTPLTYQWLFNGTPLVGGINPSLSIGPVNAANAGAYQVIVANASGSVTSRVATLTMLASPAQQLVRSRGFELGTLFGWNLGGNLGNVALSGKAAYAQSGAYGIQAGPVGSLAYLSQLLVTTPGQPYLLSLWLDSPDGQTPNEFLASWDGTNLFDRVNLGAVGWTNLQFTVTATTTSTPLQLGFRNDPSYFGIDNISVLPLGPFPPFPPQLSATSVTGDSLQFSWNTVNTYPPVGYQVQCSTNLAAANWVNLGGILTGTNDALGFTNSLGADPQRFYRVLLVQ